MKLLKKFFVVLISPNLKNTVNVSYLAEISNLVYIASQPFNIDIFAIFVLVVIGMTTITIILCSEKDNVSLVKKITSNKDLSPECIICLIDINRPERTFRCALGEGIVIGRKPERCMIVLDRDIFVAERHCRIYRENNNLMIENLCKYKKLTVSSYGRADIKLNQKCVCELSDGDIIVLGLTALKIKIS